MTTRRAWFAAVGLSAACMGGPAVQIEQDPEIPAIRWQGPVTSPPGLAGAVQIDGTAWMASGDSFDETRVHLEIENAAPGGRHPWSVQRGRRGDQGALFGSYEDYTPVEIGDDGGATVNANVPFTLPREGEYSVHLLASPSNRDLVVACGNLAHPVRNDFD